MRETISFLFWYGIAVIAVFTLLANIVVSVFLLCFASEIRKILNKHFAYFCLGSAIGSSLGGVVMWILANAFRFEEFHWAIFLFGLIFTSPSFAVLSIIAFRKNPHSSANPSTKKRSFAFGAIVFGVLSFAMLFFVKLLGFMDSQG